MDVSNGTRQQLIELTKDLVRLQTINSPPTGNELAGQLYLEEWMRRIGLDVHRVYPDQLRQADTNHAFLSDRSFKDRYCLVGIWHGKNKGKSLLLSGHIDVVPAEPLPWKHCMPFEPVVKEGRIYGRGSADMKGGLAALLIAVASLKADQFEPAGDVIIESVVDEEFAGANGTIANRLAGYHADFAINAEPTGLVVCPACVGAHIIKISVGGKAGMPYTGEAIYNPAYGITRIVDILRKYESHMAQEPCHPLWRLSPQKYRSVIVTKLSAGETGEHGQLSLPINAWTEVVIQTYPGEEAERSYNQFRQFFDREAQAVTELIDQPVFFEREYRYVEPSEIEIDHEGIQALASCVRDVTNEAPKIYGAPFSCDLAAFGQYGNTPACVFGPVGGNLHAPDEWVDVDSLVKTTQIITAMIKEWCS